jgi:uncharacterized membrane protein
MSNEPRASASLFDAGRLLFPVTILAFGIEHLVYAGSRDTGMYPWVLGPPGWNCAWGALLITLSACVAIRKRAAVAASLLGTILCLYALFLYGPRVVGPWASLVSVGSPLAAASEILAMSGAAWVLAGGRLEKAGRLLFAGTLVVFGLQHFLYTAFLASLIPSWLPFHLFWEYVVGAAFLAAAAGIAFNRAARPAALLLGCMFALFVLVLHAPRVAAAVTSRDEWTSTLVAVAMCGGAFVLAAASDLGERAHDAMP